MDKLSRRDFTKLVGLGVGAGLILGTPRVADMPTKEEVNRIHKISAKKNNLKILEESDIYHIAASRLWRFTPEENKSRIDQALRFAKYYGFKVAVIDDKTVDGNVVFNTKNKLAKEMGAKRFLYELGWYADRCVKYGIVPAVRQTISMDRIYAQHHGLRNFHVSPEDEKHQEYNLEIAREADDNSAMLFRDYVRNIDMGKVIINPFKTYVLMANFNLFRRNLDIGTSIVDFHFGRLTSSWNLEGKCRDPTGQDTIRMTHPSKDYEFIAKLKPAMKQELERKLSDFEENKGELLYVLKISPELRAIDKKKIKLTSSLISELADMEIAKWEKVVSGNEIAYIPPDGVAYMAYNDHFMEEIYWTEPEKMTRIAAARTKAKNPTITIWCLTKSCFKKKFEQFGGTQVDYLVQNYNGCEQAGVKSKFFWMLGNPAVYHMAMAEVKEIPYIKNTPNDALLAKSDSNREES